MESFSALCVCVLTPNAKYVYEKLVMNGGVNMGKISHEKIDMFAVRLFCFSCSSLASIIILLLAIRRMYGDSHDVWIICISILVGGVVASGKWCRSLNKLLHHVFRLEE